MAAPEPNESSDDAAAFKKEIQEKYGPKTD
jgi:hypothetical protein